LGGGEAVVSAALDVTVVEKVTGTFSLLFVLFLLFSWGDTGVTRASLTFAFFCGLKIFCAILL
jgi:hypothetical protein